MDSEKYLEGQSMQRPPHFESDSLNYWKNKLEIYVKSKDLDLWHVITEGDFLPIQNNPETKLDEVVPFKKQNDDLKKRLTKNNEAKMVIYNTLPRRVYERIFMCNTAKEISKTLLITHQGNSQVKDNKIDLLVTLARTTLGSFLRLYILNGEQRNLKVHEMIIKKDSEIVKAKGERKSFALKAKKESSDEESSTSRSEDEEYAMAVRDFKKFFNRRGRECPKPPRDKNQKAFVGGSWSDSGEEDDEKAKDKACLMAHASSEVHSESSYFSDENPSIDDIILDSAYNRLCKMSFKIITKNKHLKAIRNSLENEISELKEKLSKLKRNKEVDLKCTTCQTLKNDNEKLKEEALKLTQFQKSTHSPNEMLSIQKPSGDKSGLGFNSFEVSTSGTKKTEFVKSQKETSSGGGPPIADGGPHNALTAPKANQGLPVYSSKNGKFVSFQKSILGPIPKHITVNNVKIPVASGDDVKRFYKPSLKPGVGFPNQTLDRKLHLLGELITLIVGLEHRNQQEISDDKIVQMNFL
ncbi:hypothetical protein Tco_1502328 [Tanacetum coccineum]